MTKINLKFQHFQSNLTFSNIEITCVEPRQHLNKVVACSVVTIELIENCVSYSINVKFEWLESLYKLQEDDFCFIHDTSLLFFKSTHQWGVIDIKNKRLIRHEDAFCFPTIEKYEHFVLIEDELYAESVTFGGERIDNVPIDPPYEVNYFDNRIEYTSPVYGHQILKIK